MSNWPLVALDEIFEIARGGSPRPIDAYITDDPDGINWISISDASESLKYITRTKKRIRKEGASRSRAVKPGDFLLSNSMSFGKPYIMGTHGCIHDGWLVLTPRRKNVDSDFFYHLLGSQTVYREFERRAAGATVKNLNIELVKRVEIPFPPISEQRRIAAILDQADALRTKRRQAISKLDTLIPELFFDAFEARRQRHQIVELSEVCKRITDGTHQATKWSPAGYPFLFVSNIVAGEIDFRTEKFISPETHRELVRRCPIDVGDVLYTTVGSYGNAALVRDIRPFAFQRHIAHIKPDAELIEPEFLWVMMQSKNIRRQADRQARGIAQKTLNLRELQAFSVILPPKEEQASFLNKVRGVRRLVEAARSSTERLDTLFLSLQHRAFRGEL